MKDKAIQTLKKILEEQDLSVVEHGEWLVVNENYPILTAYVATEKKSEGATARLDVLIRFDEDDIYESFADYADNEELALSRAFENFSKNTLPVLVNSFWYDNDEVAKEEWEDESGILWNVVLGNYGLKSSGQKDMSLLIPDNFYETIRETIINIKKEEKLHWCRIYYANIGDGDVIHEFLWDNELEESGVESLKNLHWGKTDEFFSLRNFIVMYPAYDENYDCDCSEQEHSHKCSCGDDCDCDDDCDCGENCECDKNK